MKKSIITAMLLGGIMGINAQTKQDSIKNIEEVELFGELRKQPQGLEIITRMPLQPKDQLQNISVISNRAITEMGALSITDAARNVPGVVLFSTYGGGAESMSIRGYRGTPTLKNGVLMNSDFRRSSMIADMQGVESIQVIRGAASITQGVTNTLGAAGGVINIITKTPKFIDATNVGFRYGSWDTYRPTLDFQKVLDKNRSIAVRLNIAYQNNKSFTDFVKGERIYVNPSIAIRPDDKTEFVLQMDYLNNKRTPNRGTVNLGPDNTYAVYDPEEKFFGFATDRTRERSFSYMISADRKLTNKLKIRAAYMAMDNEVENIAAGRMTTLRGSTNYSQRQRSVGKDGSIDKSQVFQVDFIGQNIQTGILKHTFQLGFDWRQSQRQNIVYANAAGRNSINIDVIDVTANHWTNHLTDAQLAQLDNILRTGVVDDSINPLNPAIGLTFQEYLEIGKYVKLSGGIRYSKFNGNSQKTLSRNSDKAKKYAWDPSAGIIISPTKNINLYGSYTTSTSLRGSGNLTPSGEAIGASVSKQIEAGFKTDWFNEKLRFNANYFKIDANNLAYEIPHPTTGAGTGRYGKAGDLTRQGVELELVGRILPELEIMAGYTYLDAKYKNSPSFVDGSAPIMAGKHTANGWLNYTFRDGILKGLNFGGGAYYVGDRPSNDHTQRPGIIHDTDATKPFLFKAYTTINAQIGYTFENISIKVFGNNLTNSVGYSAYYRGGFTNRTDPRNFAVQVNYKF